MRVQTGVDTRQHANHGTKEGVDWAIMCVLYVCVKIRKRNKNKKERRGRVCMGTTDIADDLLLG